MMKSSFPSTIGLEGGRTTSKSKGVAAQEERPATTCDFLVRRSPRIFGDPR